MVGTCAPLIQRDTIGVVLFQRQILFLHCTRGTYRPFFDFPVLRSVQNKNKTFLRSPAEVIRLERVSSEVIVRP